MPKLAAKHQNQSTALVGDFSGGLNTAAAEEFIEDNQLSEVVNMEADSITKKLSTCLGTTDIVSIDTSLGSIVYSFWDNINDRLLSFTDKGNVLTWKDDMSSCSLCGTLNGIDYDNISCVCWEDGVLIANGGHIQYATPETYEELVKVGDTWEYQTKYDKYSLSTIGTSPVESYGIFTRSGRVIVHDGDDNLLYSGVGDETSWEQDANDPSTALFLEIGYKAGGKIISVCPNSTDILIIKDNGMCYKLENEYPDWTLSEVSRELYCNSVRGSCSLGNGTAIVLGNGILQQVTTTQDYGDMRPSQMGQQIAQQIVALPTDTKLKYIASLNQVWFITGTQYVLVYDVGTGSFFQRWFNAAVTDVVSVGQITYIIRPDRISVLSYNNGYCQDYGEPLVFQARLKTDVSLHNYLVKRICISATPWNKSYDTADVLFSVGRVDLPFPLKKAGTKLIQTIGDTQKGEEPSETPLSEIYYPRKALLLEARKMFRCDRVRIFLSGKGFPFTLNFITYDKVEV